MKISESDLRALIREQLAIALCENKQFLIESNLNEDNIFKTLYNILFAKDREEKITSDDITDDEAVVGDEELDAGLFGMGGGDFDAAKTAEDEYLRWGGRKEKDPAMKHLLKKYWKAAGRDGLARSDRPWTEPWSAAFISYLKKDDPNFPVSAAHKKYMRRAKSNRDDILDSGGKPGGLGSHGVSKGEPVAYRPEEKLPAIGDLTCNPRGTGDGFDRVGSKNHCDIYVGGDEVIGGNLSNTVRKRAYDPDKITMIISQDSRSDPDKTS